MKHLFTNDFEIGPKVPLYTIKEHDIINEPMLFGADWKYACDNADSVTHKVIQGLLHWDVYLKHLHNKTLNIKIDTRVTMLMPGWYPSIPGWHCDEWDRPENQPVPRWHPEAMHFMCIIPTVHDLSRTEFMKYGEVISYDEKDVWTTVNKESEKKRAIFDDVGAEFGVHIPENTLVRFSPNALHRATPAIRKGWRYFFRLSFTPNEPVNKTRSQVQVYLDVGKGW